jgi:sugar phosphate isomerase/epimerase
MKLSVTTVTMPDCDLNETAQLLSDLGFDGVEWRVRRIPDDQRNKPYNPWGNVKNDFTPEMLADQPQILLDISKAYNLSLVGLATNISADQYDDIRRIAEACAACNAPFFKVGAPEPYDGSQSYNDVFQKALVAYRKAINISREYGARMVVEVHRNTIMVSTSLAYRLVSHFDPKDIGVIYDLSNMTMEGFEGFNLSLELLGPYLAHVHVAGRKPVIEEQQTDGTAVWGWEATSLAEGMLNYEQCFRDLKAIGYAGYVSLEDFRLTDTRTKLEEGIAYLSMLDKKTESK